MDKNMGASGLTTPESLIEWMRGLVTEWQELDGKVYSVASVGNERLREDGDSIAANLFAVIEDQTGDTFHSSQLLAALDRLGEVLEEKRHG